MEGGTSRGDDGDENRTAFVGDLIAVGVLNFSDELVSLQQPEFSADGSGTAAALGVGGRFGRIQQLLQISIPESVDQKLSLVDRRQ